MGFEVIWMRGHQHPLSGLRVFSSAQWRKLRVKISSELQLGERRHKYKKRVQCELVCQGYLAYCSQRLSIFVIPIKLFYSFNFNAYKPLFTLTTNRTYICLNSAPPYNSTTTLSWLPTYLIPSPIYISRYNHPSEPQHHSTTWQRHIVEKQKFAMTTLFLVFPLIMLAFDNVNLQFYSQL